MRDAYKGGKNVDEIKEVFISYHEASAGKLVEDIAKQMESAGISCWYAKRDLPPGGDFADYIPPQIYGCKVFLLILNEGANNSRHVESEVGLAFRRYNKGEKITILPYQVEKCDFAHWLDYYLIHIKIQSAKIASISALVTEIARKLGRKPEKNGWCGQTAKWTLKDNILTISKDERADSGKMGDFYYQNIPPSVNTPWCGERENITSIMIENGVKNIGELAFCACSSLTIVSIPDSVTKIGDWAFRNCSALTSVNLPDSVTRIGDWAFRDCDKLIDVSIPDSVMIVGIGAFHGCNSLKSVSVPASAEIDWSAFDDTTQVIRRPPQ